MKKNILFAYIVFIAITFLACQRDTDSPAQPVPDKMVNTAFVGKITNEAGEPLEDVAVTAGGKNY